MRDSRGKNNLQQQLQVIKNLEITGINGTKLHAFPKWPRHNGFNSYQVRVHAKFVLLTFKDYEHAEGGARVSNVSRIASL